MERREDFRIDIPRLLNTYTYAPLFNACFVSLGLTYGVIEGIIEQSGTPYSKARTRTNRQAPFAYAWKRLTTSCAVTGKT
jgi:hypothetical protein